MALRHHTQQRGAATPPSHREVGLLLGISRSRVQQLEEGAMKKIHKALAGQARAAGMGIRDYLFSDSFASPDGEAQE